MKRWPIKNLPWISLPNFHYWSPNEEITIHTLMDVLTSLQMSRLDHSELWDIIVHGFEALNLECVEKIEALKESIKNDSSNYERVNVLFTSDDGRSQRLQRMLWRCRCAHMALPMSWKGILEGHPLLAGIPYREDWSELTDIADSAFELAGLGRQKANDIDLFLVKLWGQQSELTSITAKDIACRTDAIVELNSLYDREYFFEPSDED